jgi:hypothetical protein
VENAVFWDVVPYSIVEANRRFGETTSSVLLLLASLASTGKMEA